jgi:predicted AAA+ superfamily ATPase
LIFYHFERIPEPHVIVAGSLLEFQIKKIGLPVGRISMMYMHPLSFREFLVADRNDDYLTVMNGIIIPVEIKSGKEGTLKSMRLFLETHSDSPYGIRFYGGMPHTVDNIRSLPLYCVACLIKKQEQIENLRENLNGRGTLKQ